LTEVFFYHGAADRLAAACSLLGGAHAKRKPVIVFAPDGAIATALDRLLWSQPALGFVPHCRIDSPLAPETSILIADQIDMTPQNDRLMNLSDSVPPGFARFQSLIEVVGQDTAGRDAARERVRFYKDRGYSVRYYDLSER
jgi:DNA polymerase-3 subunit chi